MAGLKEELEKEAMYVEYLERLLTDIEVRRQERRSSRGSEREEEVGGVEEGEAGEGGEEIDYTVTSGSPGNKQQFLEDQCERQRQKSFSQRASLHLELESPQEEGERKVPSSFVTVINVPAPKGEDGEGAGEGARCGTYTKPRPAKREVAGAGSLGRRPVPRVPGRLYRRQESRESLGSVSSPLSPSSPVEGGGEAPAMLQDSSSPSPPSTTTSSGRTKPEPPVRAPRAKEQQADAKSLSSSEELDLTTSRGRPDGGEGEEEAPPPAPLDRASKVGAPPPPPLVPLPVRPGRPPPGAAPALPLRALPDHLRPPGAGGAGCHPRPPGTRAAGLLLIKASQPSGC